MNVHFGVLSHLPDQPVVGAEETGFIMDQNLPREYARRNDDSRRAHLRALRRCSLRFSCHIVSTGSQNVQGSSSASCAHSAAT